MACLVHHSLGVTICGLSSRTLQLWVGQKVFDRERKEEFPGQCVAGGWTAGANSKRAASIGSAVERSYWEIKRNWLVKEFHFTGTASLLSCLQQRTSGPIITVPHPTSVESIIIFIKPS